MLVSAAIGVTPASGALPVPTSCQVDLDGPNDQPGQKDITRFCVDPGAGTPFELHTSASLDDAGLSGANTGDFCTLFDSNNNGMVDLAVCTTLSQNPATLSAVRLFTCADSAPNKCTGSVQLNVCTGGGTCLSNSDCPVGQTCAQTFDTACEVSQQANDPFVVGSNYPLDSVAVCAVDLNEFGPAGANARLIDACSYPSASPNSDPSDCVIYRACTTAAQCDDGNACTIDTCETAFCRHTPNTGATCDDGNVCTLSTTCNSQGFCTNGTSAPCDDGNPCTVGTCDPSTGCSFAPVVNGTSCDDGQYCTAGDVCTGGVCGGSPRNCSDGIACTTDTCNESTDECVHAGNNASCSNGQYCDGVEVCNPAVGCVAGPPVVCSDGLACTLDTCNETLDRCDHAPDDGVCNDMQYCNGVETCSTVFGCQAGTPVNCSDGIPCTADTCDEVVDQCVHTPNHTTCSNGQYCDGAEICDPLVGCRAGAPVDCGDGVACTTDSCNESTDQCQHTPNHAICSNDQFCDGAETCDPINDCQPGTPPACGDGVPCTTDSCNEDSDECEHVPNDGACSNGQYCDGVETCDPLSGCEAGTAVSCDDGVSCTVDACNEASDSCSHSTSNALCDDGAFCNGAETCDAVNDCQPGTPPNCSDGVSCTVDSCNEATDSCAHVANNAVCNDGQFCNGTETCNLTSGCQAGPPPNCADSVVCTLDACDEVGDTCTHTPMNAVCNDSQFCNGVETCSALAGCQNGTPPNCNDGVSCTADSCDEVADVCKYVPNNGACSDGAFCDGVEICDPVSDCQPGSDPCPGQSLCNENTDQCVNCLDNSHCDNGVYCDGAETCNVATGVCQPGTPPSCNDGVSCTQDSCNESTDSCAHTPSDAACSDSRFCTGVETCDPVSDCQPGTPPNCDDGVSCTTDACSETLDSCVHTPNDAVCVNDQFCDGAETCDPVGDCQPGTAPCAPGSCSEVLNQCVDCLVDAQCDNGKFCDGVETCDETTGGCVPGTPAVCNDGIACTTDTCNATANACVYTPNNAACSNGLYCDGVESCNPASGCEAGTPVVCVDTVDCTVDSCNEEQDRCNYVPDNTRCSDGLFCNGAEVCSLTLGCRPGTALTCSDGVSCTLDACNETLDRCDHLPNDALCSDGLFCNGAEVCDPVNRCVSSPPVVCNDGVACTTDYCDEFADTCDFAPNHALCGNGLYCDGAEVCDPVGGCETGAPVDCNDENACTANSCYEALDICVAEDICCGNGTIDIGEECDDGNLEDADGCDSNCKYTRCGNGVVTPGEECEYTEICGNLIDDDEDGLYDCADPDCEVDNCTADCKLAPPCICIEEDPAIVLLSKTPNFFRIHGRIPGDVFTIDPQSEGVTIQLTNANGVIYQAMLPPNSFIVRSASRFKYKDKTAVTGVDPVGPHAGLAQVAMRFRVIDGVSYLTFKLKAYGDFSSATLPCMTTQVTVGDDLSSLRADWTLRKAGAWWLRRGDYVCPSTCASEPR